ncbi:MAG: hypothetical protein ABIV51_09320, partial [Saprospiraceae bacterium]
RWQRFSEEKNTLPFFNKKMTQKDRPDCQKTTPFQKLVLPHTLDELNTICNLVVSKYPYFVHNKRGDFKAKTYTMFYAYVYVQIGKYPVEHAAMLLHKGPRSIYYALKSFRSVLRSNPTIQRLLNDAVESIMAVAKS